MEVQRKLSKNGAEPASSGFTIAASVGASGSDAPANADALAPRRPELAATKAFGSMHPVQADAQAAGASSMQPRLGKEPQHPGVGSFAALDAAADLIAAYQLQAAAASAAAEAALLSRQAAPAGQAPGTGLSQLLLPAEEDPAFTSMRKKLRVTTPTALSPSASLSPRPGLFPPVSFQAPSPAAPASPTACLLPRPGFLPPVTFGAVPSPAAPASPTHAVAMSPTATTKNPPPRRRGRPRARKTFTPTEMSAVMLSQLKLKEAAPAAASGLVAAELLNELARAPGAAAAAQQQQQQQPPVAAVLLPGGGGEGAAAAAGEGDAAAKQQPAPRAARGMPCSKLMVRVSSQESLGGSPTLQSPRAAPGGAGGGGAPMSPRLPPISPRAAPSYPRVPPGTPAAASAAVAPLLSPRFAFGTRQTLMSDLSAAAERLIEAATTGADEEPDSPRRHPGRTASFRAAQLMDAIDSLTLQEAAPEEAPRQQSGWSNAAGRLSRQTSGERAMVAAYAAVGAELPPASPRHVQLRRASSSSSAAAAGGVCPHKTVSFGADEVACYERDEGGAALPEEPESPRRLPGRVHSGGTAHPAAAGAGGASGDGDLWEPQTPRRLSGRAASQSAHQLLAAVDADSDPWLAAAPWAAGPGDDGDSCGDEPGSPRRRPGVGLRASWSAAELQGALGEVVVDAAGALLVLEPESPKRKSRATTPRAPQEAASSDDERDSACGAYTAAMAFDDAIAAEAERAEHHLGQHHAHHH
jgi:hypothetical protein